MSNRVRSQPKLVSSAVCVHPPGTGWGALICGRSSKCSWADSVGKPPGRLPVQVFWARPTKRRPQGSPKTRWRDYIAPWATPRGAGGRDGREERLGSSSLLCVCVVKRRRVWVMVMQSYVFVCMCEDGKCGKRRIKVSKNYLMSSGNVHFIWNECNLRGADVKVSSQGTSIYSCRSTVRGDYLLWSSPEFLTFLPVAVVFLKVTSALLFFILHKWSLANC